MDTGGAYRGKRLQGTAIHASSQHPGSLLCSRPCTRPWACRTRGARGAQRSQQLKGEVPLGLCWASGNTRGGRVRTTPEGQSCASFLSLLFP